MNGLRKNGLSILYVCGEDRATTKQRLLALGDLEIDVDVIYSSLLNENISIATKIVRAALRRIGLHPERNKENKQIKDKISIKNYDILFIEKGLTIRASTLKRVKSLQPNIKIVSYFLDDISLKHNFTYYYRKSLHIYDCHFTMNKWNVDELIAKGVKNVYHFYNSYSTHVHHPVEVNSKEREYFGCDVGFVGTFEDYRVKCIRHLAENGIKVKIWGWGANVQTTGMVHPNIVLNNVHVFDDDYAKVICATKINLCFLRKINRDTQTTRTFEIPAMGGFMLAERTDDHVILFEEDKEAAFFSSKEELLVKVKYYLKNESERRAISFNGLNRCHSSKYSYQEQMKLILNVALLV